MILQMGETEAQCSNAYLCSFLIIPSTSISWAYATLQAWLQARVHRWLSPGPPSAPWQPLVVPGDMSWGDSGGVPSPRLPLPSILMWLGLMLLTTQAWNKQEKLGDPKLTVNHWPVEVAREKGHKLISKQNLSQAEGQRSLSRAGFRGGTGSSAHTGQAGKGWEAKCTGVWERRLQGQDLMALTERGSPHPSFSFVLL